VQSEVARVRPVAGGKVGFAVSSLAASRTSEGISWASAIIAVARRQLTLGPGGGSAIPGGNPYGDELPDHSVYYAIPRVP
jgi:hypothetical protein